MDSNDFQLKVLNPYCCDIKFLKSNSDFGNTLYSVPLEQAIRIIATRRADKKSSNTSLKEYLEIWKKEFEIADKEVRNIFNSQKV